MKVRVSAILYVLIALVYIVHARWLYLLDISWNRGILISILSMLAFFLYIILVRRKSPSIVNKITVSFMLMLCLQVLLSWVRYGQSFGDTLINASEFFILLLIYPMCFYVTDRASLERLENLIIVIGMSVAALLTIQTLVLEPVGLKLINVSYARRMGGLRYVNSTEPIVFGAVLSIARLLRKRTRFLEKCMLISSIVLGSIELLLVNKTKASIFTYLICILCFLFFKFSHKDRKNPWKKIIILLIAIVGLYMFLNSEIVSMYIYDYIAAKNTQYDTLSIRMKEMNHAMETLKFSWDTLLFGTGFIVSDSSFSYIVNGTAYNPFSRTDIGIFGFIHQFGLVGAFWLLYVCWYAAQAAISSWKNRQDKYEFWGVFTIFIMGLPTIFLFNGERLPYFPLFLLYVVCFLRREDNRENKKLIRIRN